MFLKHVSNFKRMNEKSDENEIPKCVPQQELQD